MAANYKIIIKDANNCQALCLNFFATNRLAISAFNQQLILKLFLLYKGDILKTLLNAMCKMHSLPDRQHMDIL